MKISIFKKKPKKDVSRYDDMVALFNKKLGRIGPHEIDFDQNKTLVFKHSGNCGDVIYALPCVLAIIGDRKADIAIHLNQPAGYASFIEHPMGNVMINDTAYQYLLPLLQYQKYVSNAFAYVPGDCTVDVDLDIMREYPLLLDRGNIARWYFQVFGVNFDLNKAWLEAPKDARAEGAIVIARSNRYHAPGISYSFLASYSQVLFIGLISEYELLKLEIPNLVYVAVNNFLEMAAVINGSKLFIGNQSFPFSLAEGLKVNRLLEVHFECPNVCVYGENGFDFCFQKQFEKLVRERYEVSA